MGIVKKQSEIVIAPNAELLRESGVDSLLSSIRPHWKAKDLIQRVNRLIPVDPSSACQRLFNASIHDLKEKLGVAGFDIVSEAAKLNKLPPVTCTEDIEKYTPYNTIELAYRVGILSRAEARRLFRVYDIRGDLEHEDDQYEATVEDCFYVFKTCIDCVLSRDPIQVIRLTDIKDIVEQPTPATLDQSVIDDYEHAPNVRQLEIHKFLISTSLNITQPDIVRQNCYAALQLLRPVTDNHVLIESSKVLVEKIGRNPANLLQIRVAYSSGILPYLKKNQVDGFFKTQLAQMEATGYSFRNHAKHRELLQNFREIGGLEQCPDEHFSQFVEWLILCYIGEPGGYGQGWNRRVFYSNVGAPVALELLCDQKDRVRSCISKLEKESKRIRSTVIDDDVSKRFDEIKDRLTK